MKELIATMDTTAIINIILSSGNFLKWIILVLGLLFFLGGSLDLLLLEEGLKRKFSKVIVFLTGILGISLGMILLILFLIIFALT